MRSKEEFFKTYNIKVEDFEKTGLAWIDLQTIYDDFSSYRDELEPSAILIFNRLMKAKNVHSVRYRVKDAEHLIEKIIRRKIENEASNITIDNYKLEVTDLIGLRALHLFKENWEHINDFIKSNWNVKGLPVANFRKGDSEDVINFFKEKGCEPNEHKYGYRSVHYIIETQPGKKKYYAEIQVRTIFEEAWSEIDHTIRYPYDLHNPILFQFLSILNRFAGGADEMGSFIKFLKNELENRQTQYDKKIDEKDKLINGLEKKLENADINKIDVEELKKGLEKLRRESIYNLDIDNTNPVFKNRFWNTNYDFPRTENYLITEPVFFPDLAKHAIQEEQQQTLSHKIEKKVKPKLKSNSKKTKTQSKRKKKK